MPERSLSPGSFSEDEQALARALTGRIAGEIAQSGGWIGFDRFMALALYTPGLGYYANARPKIGLGPSGGSDFATAPVMSPLFAACLARQIDEALNATGTDTVWEFGAGTGVLARDLITHLRGLRAARQRSLHYRIVELSAALRERQQQALADSGADVAWVSTWPDVMHGVVVGNEVLDAMPVQLLHRQGGQWHERGVALRAGSVPPELVWADRPTALRPPVDVPGSHDYTTELHVQAQAFVRELGARLQRGAAFFIDYGFPEAEYWHPQRDRGTLLCHRGHRSDDAPLQAPGLKDITAHVDFTGVALAAQDSGLSVLGYTSQARFLMNCGMLDLLSDDALAQRSERERIALRAMAQKLLTEHEMGELFKAIGLVARASADAYSHALGFATGDRTHTL